MNPQPNPEIPDIHDIAPPVSVPGFPEWIIYAAIALGVLLLLAWVGWIVWQRMKKGPAPLTPRQQALKRLAEAEGEVSALKPHDFSVLVSDILRSFISDEHHIRARQQTSPEVLEELNDSGRFTGEIRNLLDRFLRQADTLKFAPVEGSAEESRELLEQAKHFVNEGDKP